MKRKMFIAVASCLVIAGTIGITSCSGTNTDFKVGVILVGDETEGYTEAHMNGIEEARKELGLNENQILYRKKVSETNDCKVAAEDLVSKDCSLIISNSYGHQEYMYSVARENEDIQFVSDTGDFAAISGIKNFRNAFTKIYESRYVSGVVAGMKLKELIDGKKLAASNQDDDGNYKIGYVGAYTYAEVISGYTAFYLGIKSVVSTIAMQVQFTDSWFDIDKEAKAAETLVNNGCVIIGQHADSTGAPSKCESLLSSGKVCYSVGYNVDMLKVAPNASLTSATNNWGVYYKYAIKQAMEGKDIKTDWAEGYNEGAVAITTLGKSVATGTDAKVKEVEGKIKDGSLKVFDTSSFKVEGKEVTTNIVDMSLMDYSTSTPTVKFKGEKKETIVKSGSTSYVDESTFRSAPYFALKIDGISWLNK